VESLPLLFNAILLPESHCHHSQDPEGERKRRQEVDAEVGPGSNANLRMLSSNSGWILFVVNRYKFAFILKMHEDAHFFPRGTQYVIAKMHLLALGPGHFFADGRALAEIEAYRVVDEVASQIAEA